MSTLFQFLAKAKVFSKFDLKAGFWQLGIRPDERPKTAFCIPNAHYQWTVLPFGLKVAPSIFQKAMVRIFAPILHSALVYIDDILLFSTDDKAHKELLLHFCDIIQRYGIMLSEKKSSIGQTSIDFLGMNFSNGQYRPNPNIAQELLKFPDTNLSQKQIQQFLGIVNYLREFIPHCSKLTSILSQLLKKEAPPWGPTHTTAVKQLKTLTQNLPPLSPPTNGHKILQTDASDTNWGAILLEKTESKERLCGYASGTFTTAEAHYHSNYKEILAVKNGIKKYQFFLIGQCFTVRMDNSAFPRILDFRNKMLPQPQLLRLKEWFTQFCFRTEHIKGDKNLIPDMLSRPPEKQAILHISYMMSSPRRVLRSASCQAQRRRHRSIFDLWPGPNKPIDPKFADPPSAFSLAQTVEERRLCALRELHHILHGFRSVYGRDHGLGITSLSPKYPAFQPLYVDPFLPFTEAMLWFLCYFTHLFYSH